MKNFKNNSEEMNWPWVESPFFPELIKTENLTDEEKLERKNLQREKYRETRKACFTRFIEKKKQEGKFEDFKARKNLAARKRYAERAEALKKLKSKVNF